MAIRLRLTTALGLDDAPAEVPTWGTVTAQVARTLIEQRHAGEWRLVLTDPDGRLRHLLLLRHRPARTDPARPSPPAASIHARAVVELQVPTTDLARIDPADHPSWIAVLRDAHARAADLVAPLPNAHPATTRGDAARRRAGAELDRWIRTRDRHCLGVMCTSPAHSADLDHTRDWAHGGVTVAANLGVLCRHTHRLKHHGGWTLEQTSPGRFRWTSRAGATYDVRPRPVTPALPAPRPRPDGRPRVPVEESRLPQHTDTADHDTASWAEPTIPTLRHAARAAMRSADTDPSTLTTNTSRYPDEPPF